MTDQEGDQAALNGLVDDCYPDGWPWRKYDITRSGVIKKITYNFVWECDFLEFYGQERPSPTYTNTVLASTWVEGRLRELIGEAFRGLYNYGGEWMCEYFIKEALLECSEGCPTPIQALVAALRVLKQKEVEGGDD